MLSFPHQHNNTREHPQAGSGPVSFLHLPVTFKTCLNSRLRILQKRSLLLTCHLSSQQKDPPDAWNVSSRALLSRRRTHNVTVGYVIRLIKNYTKVILLFLTCSCFYCSSNNKSSIVSCQKILRIQTVKKKKEPTRAK